MDDRAVERLSVRAALAGVVLEPALAVSLVKYLDVLSRWNAKINLTSLTDPDEAVDRLLLEPVAAAASLPHRIRLMDLGSGGGSPAIPLGLALQAVEVVMIESRGRKAAFLREAAREVGLPARVEAARFEDVAQAGTFAGSMDVVTMRAVRMDESALHSAATFMNSGGVLALFVSAGTAVGIPGFLPPEHRRLIGTAELVLLRSNVPRGT